MNLVESYSGNSELKDINRWQEGGTHRCLLQFNIFKEYIPYNYINLCNVENILHSMRKALGSHTLINISLKGSLFD